MSARTPTVEDLFGGKSIKTKNKSKIALICVEVSGKVHHAHQGGGGGGLKRAPPEANAS